MNNYKTIRFIGKGSFGKVYEVEDLKTSKRYAIKSVEK